MDYQVIIGGAFISLITSIAAYFAKSYFKRIDENITHLTLVLDKRLDEIREIRTIVHIMSSDVKAIADEIIVHKKKIHELSGYLNGDAID